MKKRHKKQKEAPKPVSPCYWARIKRESAPFERTSDFKARIHEEKLEAALKRRDARFRQLQKRGY